MPVRSRGHTLLLALLLVAALWLFVEMVAVLALHLGGSSWSELRQAMQTAAKMPQTAGGDAPQRITDSLLKELRMPETGGSVPVRREVVHPFLGFVFNPALNEAEQRRAQGRLEIGPEGFFRPPGPPPSPPAATADGEGGPLRVGVFGGSFAFLLSFEGRDELVDDLARRTGRRVEVESWALGGYKQPQQLATLAWLLARGHRFDVVVDLDGFNDVVLPMVENLPQHVALDYPRGWAQRVGGFTDPRALREVGTLVLLRERRAARARGFAAAPWRWSPAAALLWHRLDGADARRIATAETRLAGLAGDGGAAADGFQAHGPFVAPASREDAYRQLADLWRRSSLQMHRLCAANGILYLHFLQPNQYVPGSKPMGRAERARAFDEQQPYRRPVEEGYPWLQRAGEALSRDGVRFHDLTRIWEDVAEPRYHDTCCHVNRTGSVEVAAVIAGDVADALAATPASGTAPTTPRP